MLTCVSWAKLVEPLIACKMGGLRFNIKFCAEYLLPLHHQTGMLNRWSSLLISHVLLGDLKEKITSGKLMWDWDLKKPTYLLIRVRLPGVVVCLVVEGYYLKINFVKCMVASQGLYPVGVVLKNWVGVCLVSRNAYPIYDQNLQYSLPYLWPDP